MVGKLNSTIDQVKVCLRSGRSFIVEAGAGSGKTWTLIESIKELLTTQGESLKKANQQIVCITYTNVAKDEIVDRIDNNSLVLVLTIHEFLWSLIKNFQNELKKEIIKFNKDISKSPIEDLEIKLSSRVIEYSQYGRMFEFGKITHEDVLEFSSQLFKKYPKLSKIVANKYPFLFIDEYQDTELRTVELLLDNLLVPNRNIILIGFFGDSMQKIYNQGIGRIPQNYIENFGLEIITKNENYRCSMKVISLLSKIRPTLVQIPSGSNLKGEISFISCNSNISDTNGNYLKTLKFLENKKGWNLHTETKILLLTHRSIANKIGYEKLLAVYDPIPFGRDRLLNKEDIFSFFFLDKVESLVRFYLSKDYRDFINLLGLEGFKINSHEDKKKVQGLMTHLIEIRKEKSVKDVMNYIFENKLLVKPVKIIEFEFEISKKDLTENELIQKTFFNSLMILKYSEFILINDFIENYTPYSTQHGVKGAEYKNVLVVIDDNSWNQYKFSDVFANIKTNENRYNRSLNLLYVCCSRAKDKLLLLSLSEMNNQAMQTIVSWFESENVYDILTLK